MAFDVIVRAFFSDNGLSAGLRETNAWLTRVGRSGPGARAGLRAFEIGARQLAFEAAGLNSGLGNVARGILAFGGGSALTLGAVAGIGAVALAYRHFTRDTREAEEAQRKLREELHRSAQARRDARIPESQRIGTQQEQRGTRFAELNRLIADREALARSQVAAQRFGHETEAEALQRLLADDKELNRLYQERRALGQDIRSDRESSADAAKKEGEERRRLNEEERRAHLERIEFAQTEIALYRGALRERRRLVFEAPFFGVPLSRDTGRPGGFPEFGRGAGVTPLGLPAPGAAATFANINRNVPRFVPGEEAKKPSKLMQDLQAAQMMTMALAMAGRGGAGGALSGIGGLLSGASGLSFLGKGAAGVLGPLGFGLGALGTVFSLFDNSEERRHKKLVEAINRMGKEVVEKGSRVFIVDGRTGAIDELRQADDHDAATRVRGWAGVTG